MEVDEGIVTAGTGMPGAAEVDTGKVVNVTVDCESSES